jgi:hypothetical protein
MGYLLKTTTELIGKNRGLVDRIGKEGSYLYSFRKSTDFISEEKLTDLGSFKVKSADIERNVKGTILQVQKKEGSCRLDYQHVFGLFDGLVHWSWP